MKLVLEKPSPLAAAELVICKAMKGNDFGSGWHHHSEVEITWVRDGGTERRVGDRIVPLVPGDLVLLGSGLPHEYRNGASASGHKRRVDAVMLQFPPNLLGDGWEQKTSFHLLGELFRRAAAGLEVKGDTRLRAYKKIRQIAAVRGVRRVVHLLEMLEDFADSTDLEIIASGKLPAGGIAHESDRLADVFRHIEEHLAEPLYLSELAGVSGLSESAFSRLFRRSTGRTVPQYVNELRISLACRFLAQTSIPVGKIAAQCGYATLAHFQRQFQRFEGRTPLAYRAAVRYRA